MSFDITPAFVQEYKATVTMLLQQRGAKLRRHVLEEGFSGKSAKAVEQIGPVSARKKTSRHGDTPLISTPHDSRWISPVSYEWADLIDRADRARMSTDPTSAYAINGAMALGRSWDDEIIKGFFAPARTGEDGNVSKAFPASQAVAVDIGAGSATGLNVAKLRAAKKLMMKNEVDFDIEPVVMAITAEQSDDLLADIQATSRDYTPDYALKDGKIERFMGIDFVHSERLPLDSDGYRRNPVWARSGMKSGMWQDLTVKMTERPDKSYAIQVYVEGTFGAVRLEEGKVVEIKCLEP